MADNYFDDFINITVSIPRSSSSRSDYNGNQVVPDFIPDFCPESGHFSDDGIVPSPTNTNFEGRKRADVFESESFYDDFFGCIKKTPDDVKRVEQNYRLSSTGELKKLKERTAVRRNNFRKNSPWRLIIEEEDILTSSPVLKKPQAAADLKKPLHFHHQRDQQVFLDFLKRCGWKTGILPG